MLNLLKILSEVAQAVILPLGSFDFCFHAGRDMTSKDPDLRTLAHDGISEKKTEFTLLLVAIIQKLWKQQVWCDGDISLFHCKAAVGSGGSYVLFDVSGKGRADIYDWSESTQCMGLTFDRRKSAVSSRVRIAFAVIFANRHVRFLLSGWT